MAGKSIDQEIVYEEFEPYCKWQRKEDRDILEIHLQDFRKEQLKVQISNHGVLKISGDRPEVSKDSKKHIKFYKEVPAPSTKYDTHAIHAKFVSHSLIITMPKHKHSAPEGNKDKAAPSEPPPADHGVKSTRGGAGEGKERAGTNVEGDVVTGQCRLKCRKRPAFGSRLGKVAVSLVVTAVAAVVLAAYVRFMYKSTVDE